MAVAVLATGCQNGSDSGLSSTSTPADSLMYYLGQMRAIEYKREAERDTAMNTPEARRAYMQGMEAGMSGMRADDEAYNKGFMQGMQMAVNMHDFTENYGLKLSQQVFLKSLKSSLDSDSLPENRKVQVEFRRLMNQIQADKEEQDKQASRETLSQEAAKMDLPKINDDLYGTVTEKTDGEAFKDGDEVNIDIKVTKADGSEIRGQLPTKVKVGGRNVPEMVTEALKTMKDDETAKFATTAVAFYGQRAKQMGLEPTDVVCFTVKAETVKEEPADKK